MQRDHQLIRYFRIHLAIYVLKEPKTIISDYSSFNIHVCNVTLACVIQLELEVNANM